MLASAAVVVALYYADLANTPVLANYLDALGDRVVGAWPVLRQFHVASMILPCLVVGLAFFIVATVLVAIFVRARTGEKMERRLKKAADRKRRRLRKIEIAECVVLDQPTAWPLCWQAALLQRPGPTGPGTTTSSSFITSLEPRTRRRP